jgi:hypothetical protein
MSSRTREIGMGDSIPLRLHLERYSWQKCGVRRDRQGCGADTCLESSVTRALYYVISATLTPIALKPHFSQSRNILSRCATDRKAIPRGGNRNRMLWSIFDFGNREFLHEWGVIPIFVKRTFLAERKLVGDCRAALWAKLVLRVFSHYLDLYSPLYSKIRGKIYFSS